MKLSKRTLVGSLEIERLKNSEKHSEVTVLKQKMQEFGQELKDLKQTSMLMDNGRRAHEETRNYSQAEELRDSKRHANWDDFPPVDQQKKVAQSAFVNPTEADSQHFLRQSEAPKSTNLRERPKIGASPALFQEIFTKVEAMKQQPNKTGSQSQVSQSGHRRDKSSLSQKSQIVIPSDLKTDVSLNKKVEQRIISSLIGEVNFEEQLSKRTESQRSLPPVKQSPKEQRESDPIDEFALNHYIDLSAFQTYEQPKNLLYLKASSLFNDTILFENDFLSLFCRTDKRALISDGQVALVLTFKPKIGGSNLITFIENELSVRVEPQNLVVQNFGEVCEQTVVLSHNDKRPIEGFPVLSVTVGPRHNETTHRIVLPFTVNKYLRGDPLSLEQVMQFLENVGL